MSDKVQFQTNVPIDVALKYNDGKEVTGQYGDQVLYTLTDGRVMYVPPIVKKKIDELGNGQSARSITGFNRFNLQLDIRPGPYRSPQASPLRHLPTVVMTLASDGASHHSPARRTSTISIPSPSRFISGHST